MQARARRCWYMLCGLIAQQTDALTPISVRLHDSLTISTYESVGGSYGRQTWPASVAAACWIVDGGAEAQLRNSRMVEVGSGTGLCSLALASCGASVLATDVDKEALSIVGIAAKACGHSSLIRTEFFDVLDRSSALPMGDVMVAADVMYSASLARGLARRCAEALSMGMRVLVADPGRPTRRDFDAELAIVGAELNLDASLRSCTFREAADIGSFSEWVCGTSGDRLLGLDLPPSQASECRRRITRHAPVADSTLL